MENYRPLIRRFVRAASFVELRDGAIHAGPTLARSYMSHDSCNLKIRLHSNYISGRDEKERKRHLFNVIVQTYALGLHYTRQSLDFDAGSSPCSSFDAPSSYEEDTINFTASFHAF